MAFQHPSVALVTTCKGASYTIRSWVDYHLHLGFDLLIIFFDDPNDDASHWIDCHEDKVLVLRNDETLRCRQMKMSVYHSLKPYLDTEVQARQQLNAETALEICLERGITWLVHIDIDELFYVINSNLKEHFQKLMRHNIGHFTYINFEAVPERMDIDDFFEEVTLFRKHLCTINLNPQAFLALEYWKKKRTHGQYFLAYDNGKSAVRVLKGVVPVSVHEWKLPSTDKISANTLNQTDNDQTLPLRSCTAISDPRNLDLNRLFKCEDAIILHYVVCGWKWYYSKYSILNAFPNYWFGGKLKIAPCFHLDSRDLYLSGDVEKMKKFYLEQVVLDDEREKQRQLDAGVCVVITLPSQIVKQYKKSHTQNDSLRSVSNTKTTLSEQTDCRNLNKVREKPRDGPPSTLNTLSLDKQWILSSLVARYLNNSDIDKPKK